MTSPRITLNEVRNVASTSATRKRKSSNAADANGKTVFELSDPPCKSCEEKGLLCAVSRKTKRQLACMECEAKHTACSFVCVAVSHTKPISKRTISKTLPRKEGTTPPMKTFKELSHALKAVLELEAPLKEVYAVLKSLHYKEDTIPIDTDGITQLIAHLIDEYVYGKASKLDRSSGPSKRQKDNSGAARASGSSLVLLECVMKLRDPLQRINTVLKTFNYQEDTIPVRTVDPSRFILDQIRTVTGFSIDAPRTAGSASSVTASTVTKKRKRDT